MKKYRTLKIIILFFIIIILIRSIPIITYKNSGESISYGNQKNGNLKNAYLLKYKTKNAKYFSLTSYYLIGNAFLNSKLYNTVYESYEECKKTCPDIYFKYMECSGSQGGKILIHKTHRNGLSIDFMVPKIKNGKQYRALDKIGLWHYILEFDSNGKLKYNNGVQIDFETMAKHIISLDNAAKKNGLRIQKIILQIDLKDNLFKSQSGKELKKRNIYFAKYLTPQIDKLHDDHYHVNFETIN